MNYNKTSNFLLYASYFSLGLTFYKIFIFLLISYTAFNTSRKMLSYNKRIVVTSLLNIFFLFILYVMSVFNKYDNLITYNVIYLFALIIVFVFTINLQGNRVNYNSINALVHGLFIYTIIVVFYTYMNYPDLFLLRKLHNPFTDTIQNSPLYAMYALIFLMFSITNILINKNYIYVTSQIILIFFSITIALFLSSRSYFLLTIIYGIIFIIQTKISFSKKMILFLGMSFLLFLSYSFLENIGVTYDVLDKFTEQGLETGRYNLYFEGIYNLLSLPTGGFEPSTRVHSYHNLWIDSGMIGGLPSFILLSTITIYALIVVYNNYNKNVLKKNTSLITFILLLIMSQDVIITGGRAIYLIFFMTIILLIARK